jgi:hypothetical protein
VCRTHTCRVPVDSRTTCCFPDSKETTSHDSSTGGQLEKTHFATLLDTKIAEWTQHVLHESFGYLVDLVERCRSDTDHRSPPLAQLTSVCRQFHDTYKQTLEELYQSMMMSFASFKTGTQIIHGVMRLFLKYYQEFADLVEHALADRDRSAIEPILVDIQHVMLEMRRYKLAFS